MPATLHSARRAYNDSPSFNPLHQKQNGSPEQSEQLGNLLGYLVAALGFYSLASIGRSWGMRRGWVLQLGWLGLAGVAAVVDFVRTGSAWGPALGLTIVVLLVGFVGYLGVSFLVAGIFAAPG